MNHTPTFAFKGYGFFTSQIIAFLICEKQVPPENIHVFEEREELGGCWLDANEHTRFLGPIPGTPINYYLPYERIQKVLSGRPFTKAKMIANLRAIHEALGFDLHLGSRIVADDPTAKKLTVLHRDGSTTTPSYDVFVSPQYRAMDTYNRSLSLRDGLKTVDLSKFDVFRVVGNSANTVETIEYILQNKLESDYQIEIYFRTFHALYPRTVYMLPATGLPVLWLLLVALPLTKKFEGLVQNKEMVDYLAKATAASLSGQRGRGNMFSSELMFHPYASSKLRFKHCSGQERDWSFDVTERTLVIDTRNEQRPSDTWDPEAIDHSRPYLGHAALHPIAAAFNTPSFNAIALGMARSLWATIHDEPVPDRLYRLGTKSVDDGKHGSTLWHYSHDTLARIVPLSYWFFPIDTIAKCLLWAVASYAVRITGLSCLLIDLEAARELGTIDDSDEAFRMMKERWEALGARTGMPVPYPVSYRAFTSARKRLHGSVEDVVTNLRWYRSLRSAYPLISIIVVAAVGSALVVALRR